jgi:hypothetical protein
MLLLGAVGVWRTVRLFIQGAMPPASPPQPGATERPRSGFFLAIGGLLSLWCILVGALLLFFAARR